MPEKTLKRSGEETQLVAFVGSNETARELEARGFRVLPLAPDGSPAEAVTEAPRLTLLEEIRGPGSDLVAQVRAVRSRWPMVDAIVVAPEASPALVRSLLQQGAHDVVLEPEGDAWQRRIEEVLDAQQYLPMVDRLADRRVRTSRFEGMLSRNHALWDVFETCIHVAPTDANVLISGETGTGKELLARAVHRRSRRKGRFVAVNCSALPENLVESEFFGHEKGAFTGAIRSSKGIFRHAEGGTVFLDEIGDMPLSAQQSLLRVLEERKVRPVGSSEEVAVDVRIVAATNVPLEEAVADETFREDLFYRLDVIRLEIPPLRERPEDVVYLFGHFAKSLSKHYGVERPKVNDDFLAALAAYAWPGNIRELENFTERAVLRGKRSLSARDIPKLVGPTEVSEQAAAPKPGKPQDASSIDTSRSLADTLRPAMQQLERRYLEALLEATGGRVQDAAHRAGVSRRTLHRKLTTHGIDRTRFRTRSEE